MHLKKNNIKNLILKFFPFLISLGLIIPILNYIGLERLLSKISGLLISNQNYIKITTYYFIENFILLLNILLGIIIGFILKKGINNIKNNKNTYNNKNTIILSFIYIFFIILLNFTNNIGNDWGGLIYLFYIIIFTSITLIILLINGIGYKFKINNKILFSILYLGNIIQILNIIFIILLILNGTHI